MTPRELAEAYNALREKMTRIRNAGLHNLNSVTREVREFFEQPALPPLPVPQDVPEVGSRWRHNFAAIGEVVTVAAVSLHVTTRWGSHSFGINPLEAFMRDATPAEAE